MSCIFGNQILPQAISTASDQSRPSKQSTTSLSNLGSNSDINLGRGKGGKRIRMFGLPVVCLLNSFWDSLYSLATVALISLLKSRSSIKECLLKQSISFPGFCSIHHTSGPPLQKH